jgi:hypothetical protein
MLSPAGKYLPFCLQGLILLKLSTADYQRGVQEGCFLLAETQQDAVRIQGAPLSRCVFQ